MGLVCAKDCFDSARAIYYNKGQSYERSDIADSRILKHFTDEETFRKAQKESLERELKSVSSVKNVKDEVIREIKSRKKLQEIDE